MVKLILLHSGNLIINYLLNENDVFTGKSQTFIDPWLANLHYRPLYIHSAGYIIISKKNLYARYMLQYTENTKYNVAGMIPQPREIDEH